MNGARNTFNDIAGRPRLITRIWCKLGIHRWQKWSDVKESPKITIYSSTELVQDRYCDHCNAYQRKRVRNIIV